ncbi:MAG TPA: Rid family hydrolase [Sphingomicrobium sp.]|nr:Rid family hydrolase [Sphingomicrobium sp.]
MRAATALLAILPGWHVAASAGIRQEATVLLSEDPEERKFQQDWGYADAIIAGETIYLSGVVAGLRDGETDLRLPYERAFARIGAILKRSGVSWDDVVDITTFHTDLTTQMPAIVAVKNKYVVGPPPAWTAIGVSRLIPDRGITELKIVAKVSRAPR